jgi:two-component system cell cycle response regulator CtrA
MRALIVSDDGRGAAGLSGLMEGAGIHCEYAEDAEDGAEMARIYDFDLVLLSAHGAPEFIHEVRGARITTPILVLSTIADVGRKVRCFGAGADDYLVMPAHGDEIVARVQALVRRSRGVAAPLVQVGDIALDLGAKSASVAGRHVHLTGREYQLLELLALRKGATLTREAMLDSLYGGRDEPELKIIDVFICKLRAKLEGARSGRIETVWGRGYRLTDGEADTPAPAPSEPAPRRLTIIESILLSLLEDERSTADLLHETGALFQSLSAQLARARDRGLVQRLGGRGNRRDGTAVHAITEAGRRWLRNRGFSEAELAA